jgi:4-hydroxybenzoate polyprenyltransferase
VTEATAPSAARKRAGAILALCRVSNLPTVWMNALAAVVLASAPVRPWTVVLLAASMSAFYCGGMCLNDIFDRESDAREQPFRPIPSGRVSLAGAWVTAVALLAAGLGLLGLAPFPSALLPGLALLGTIFAYDLRHKKSAASVLLMAACRLLVFVVCAWAVSGTLRPLVLGAGAVCFAYTLGISVAARHENRRGEPYAFPLIPSLIAGMSLVDGLYLAVTAAPHWLAAGIAASVLTSIGQRYVRGD